jgi:hypothetical protein
MSVAMADRKIDILASEVDVVQRSADPQIDAGVGHRKSRQPMHERLCENF